MSPSEFFSNYTFSMVFIGTTAIGVVAGSLGVFAYLRKQSLISDVISHSALPGTLLAFLILQSRAMSGLLVGAVIIALLAVAAVQWIERTSRISLDTAMAVVLTGFFGGGMLLMQFISRRPIPDKAGVQDYLFGNASTLTRNDIVISLAVGALTLSVMVLLWKEFTASSFDPELADLQGFSRRATDALVFAALVVATVIGLKAVGLVLMVSFVITPAAVARQFSRSVAAMVLLAGAVGGLASATGAYVSIAFGPLPTGPVIVIALAVLLFAAVAVRLVSKKVREA